MKINKLSMGRKLAILATTALVGAGFTVPAHAAITVYQGSDVAPSINFYVRVDAGLQMVTNAYNSGKEGTLVNGGGNDWGTSMFGINGDWALDADTKAVYKLESGFNSQNADLNGEGFFNRRAYVGLSNDEFGTVLIGKDLFIDNDIWGYDPMGQQNLSTATLVYGRSWNQVDQMVEYRSPSLAGLKVGAQVSFEKNSPNTQGAYSTRLSDVWGVDGQYNIGNLNVLAVYDVIKGYSGYTSLYGDSKEAIFAANYTMGPVEGYGGYQILSAPQATSGGSHAGMLWLGAAWTISPKVTVEGGWFHTKVNRGVGSADVYTAGMQYYFRPTVFWYGTVGEIVNKGQNNFNLAVDPTSYTAPAAGHNQFALYTGMSLGF